MGTSTTTQVQFQIGDRIELNVDANALRQGLLPLDPVLAGALSQAEIVVATDAESTVLKFNVAQGAFKSVKLLRPLAKQPGTFFLECVDRSPARFRLMVEPFAPIQIETAATHMVAFSADDAALLGNHSALARWRDFRLSLQQTVKEQQQQIVRLSTQIEKSYGQVQEIAVKALEGSGSARASSPDCRRRTGSAGRAKRMADHPSTRPKIRQSVFNREPAVFSL